MKPRFACADFAFPLLAHDNALKLISMMGFDGVDIGLFQGRSHLQPFSVFKELEKNAKVLKEKFDALNLAAADVFLQLDLDFSKAAVNHPEKKIRDFAREYFKKTLDFAAALKSGHTTVLPGVYFSGESRAASFDRCVSELDWRINEAAKYGIAFGVEGHIGSIISEPESILKLLKALPKLKLTLDYTHFKKQGIPDERVHGLIKYANHFHARGAANGRLQVVLPENEIDYAAIAAEMVKTNYSGYIGIEYTWTEWENCDKTDNVSESIRLKDFLKKEFSKWAN